MINSFQSAGLETMMIEVENDANQVATLKAIFGANSEYAKYNPITMIN